MRVSDLTQVSHDGGCLCGSIRYTVLGDCVRSNICHCTFCQRMTGSAFFVEPVFMKEQFRFLQGEPTVYEHVSDNSGKVLRLHFCGRCGTTVALAFDRFPDHIGVAGGSFDDPNWFPVTRHLFTRSASRHVALPPDTDLFERHATSLDGSAEVPSRLDAPKMARR